MERTFVKTLKSMKIRLAVAIDQDCRWATGGNEMIDDDHAALEAYDKMTDCNDASHVVFVEVEVPIPDKLEAVGVVVP